MKIVKNFIVNNKNVPEKIAKREYDNGIINFYNVEAKVNTKKWICYIDIYFVNGLGVMI